MNANSVHSYRPRNANRKHLRGTELDEVLDFFKPLRGANVAMPRPLGQVAIAAHRGFGEARYYAALRRSNS